MMDIITYNKTVQLSKEVGKKPDMKSDENLYADLDITDEFGNVLSRFSDGHIATKQFDSREVSKTLGDSHVSGDLDVADPDGNVLARFEDGHFQTKEFDSRNVTGIIGRMNGTTDGVYACCRWHQPSSTDKQFCILLAGDIHGDKTRINSMIEYLNKIPAFDAGIMLGDMSQGTSASSLSYYYDAISKTEKPWLTVVGNHDTYDIGSEQTLYERYMTPCIQYADLAEGEAVSGKCYYHKDFADYKIRLIVMFQYDHLDGKICYSQTQIDWLIDVLDDTPSDYGVIIAEHTSPSGAMSYNMDGKYTSSTWSQYNQQDTHMDGNPVPDIVNAWIDGGTLTQTYSYTYDNPPADLSVDVDFTQRGTGEFISYIGGHWHMDVLGYPTGYTDQPDYHVPAAGLGAAVQGDKPRMEGTLSEDSFCVFSVDRTKKKIRIYQPGAHLTKDAVDRQYFEYGYGA